jgi:hypothetical protein
MIMRQHLTGYIQVIVIYTKYIAIGMLEQGAFFIMHPNLNSVHANPGIINVWEFQGISVVGLR